MANPTPQALIIRDAKGALQSSAVTPALDANGNPVVTTVTVAGGSAPASVKLTALKAIVSDPDVLTQVTSAAASLVTIAAGSGGSGATASNQTTEITAMQAIQVNTGRIPAQGAATRSGSTPVTIASDQPAIAVSGTVTITPSGTQTVTGTVAVSALPALPAGTAIIGAVTLADTFPQRARDALGRFQVVQHVNIYEADFEYGLQPLRWQSYSAGAGTIASATGSGGIVMSITAAAGDATIRQSRPYHRYQPGKTMRMETGILFGAAITNQRARVGIFDDGNGIFFEQGDPNAGGGNPAGMYCVYRSDINGMPTDIRIPFSAWTDPDGIKNTINWNLIQMLGIEYAWYGAGALRWTVTINGDRRILHQIGIGNLAGQTTPWSRTGNLPVRYEQRNLAAAAPSQLYHYGVSVIVEGGQDPQRGFVYSYGMALTTPQRTVPAGTTRLPILSIRPRNMGTQEYTQAGAAITGTPTTTSLTVAGTPWTAGQWVGRYVYFPGTGGLGNGAIGRISANTSNTLTYADNIIGGPISAAPVAGAPYQIGYINRGLLKPTQLVLSATGLCIVEIISSTPTNPVTLIGGTGFVALNTIGSPNSLAEREVSATSVTGGEVVLAFTTPANISGVQTFDLSNFFPVYNTLQGNLADILTVVVSTPATNPVNAGAHIYCQEAMS